MTGAANGIGLACVERFVSEGARVLLADVDVKAGEAAAKRTGARFAHCDVSSKRDCESTVAAALEVFGRLDILVSNAGIVHGARFLDLKEEDFDRVLSVNLKGAFLMGQSAARAMIKGGGGSIIHMSSVNGVVAIPDQVPYVTSKGGLNQLTKVMALALAGEGVRVNGIGPGSIGTEMLKSVMNDEAARKKILSRTPMGRVGEPREIAAAALFLASDDSSYMTGQTIYVDGGRLSLNYVVATPAG